MHMDPNYVGNEWFDFFAFGVPLILESSSAPGWQRRVSITILLPVMPTIVSGQVELYTSETTLYSDSLFGRLLPRAIPQNLNSIPKQKGI